MAIANTPHLSLKRRRTSIFLRSLCAVLCVVFVAFTASQKFDPEGLSWIMGFGYVAMCALCGSLNIEIRWPSVLGAIALATWIWRIHPHEASSNWTLIEMQRETMELVIGVLALLTIALTEDARRQ